MDGGILQMLAYDFRTKSVLSNKFQNSHTLLHKILIKRLFS